MEEPVAGDRGLHSLMHIADIHLDFRAYSARDENGSNRRMMDVFNSFKYVVNYAIDNGISHILCSGDLFHSVRPSNKSIAFAIKCLERLDENGIKFLVITGNHDSPKTKSVSSVFDILGYVGDNLIIADKETYRSYDIDNKIRICMVPHCHTKEKLWALLKLARKDRDECKEKGMKSVLMAHVGVSVKDLIFARRQFDEQVVTLEEVSGFDYAALGHYHGQKMIDAGVWYSGSLEYLSFSEAVDDKGFIILDDSLLPSPHGIRDIPSMIDLPAIDVDDLDINGGVSLSDVLCKILDRIDIDGKIVRTRIENIPVSVYHTMDFRKIKGMARNTLAFKPIYNIRKEEYDLDSSCMHFKSIAGEWKDFMDNAKTPNGVNIQTIYDMGLKYLVGEDI